VPGEVPGLLKHLVDGDKGLPAAALPHPRRVHAAVGGQLSSLSCGAIDSAVLVAATTRHTDTVTPTGLVSRDRWQPELAATAGSAFSA
jgi:hypothetical protein